MASYHKFYIWLFLTTVILVSEQRYHTRFISKWFIITDFCITSQALRVCGAIIHGSSPLQQNFAQLQTSYMKIPDPLADSQEQQNGDKTIYIIEGLLDQALLNTTIQAFDVRIAACTCLEVSTIRLSISLAYQLIRVISLGIHLYGYIF